ncbi:hypothetical protein CR513_05510, partial [Mucuna pruriens]
MLARDEERWLEEYSMNTDQMRGINIKQHWETNCQGRSGDGDGSSIRLACKTREISKTAFRHGLPSTILVIWDEVGSKENGTHTHASYDAMQMLSNL